MIKERIKIVVPGDDPPQIQDSPHLERLKDYGDLTLYHDRPKDRAEKIARVAGAEVIMNTRSAVTWGHEEFAQLPDLKMITACSIGTDNFDLAAAKEHRIVISNQPGRTAPVVAEHIFGMMFAVAKRMAFFTADMKQGRWTRMDNVMLRGKKLGIIGTGAIGAEMARLGKAIGMKVIAWTYNPSAERARILGVTFKALDEVLTESDVISVHVKLTKDSHHMIGTEQFSRMKENSIFLNGSRAAVVDTDALVKALHSGKLMGAGVDVYDEEPAPADHPLFTCDHVVLTPHSADSTPEGMDLLNSGAVDNVIAYLKGHPRNRVC
jgi:D-3-phosphoglycerate dehydrogenase